MSRRYDLRRINRIKYQRNNTHTVYLQPAACSMETTATVVTSIGNTSTEAYTTDSAVSDDEIPVAVGTEGGAAVPAAPSTTTTTTTTTGTTITTNTTTTTTPTNNTTTAMTTLMEIASMNSFDSTALNESIMDSDFTTGNGNAAATVAATHGVDRRTSTAVTSVTTERKEQLLLQARYDRIQWIHQTPLPYRTGDDGTTAAVSHATFHLPTAQKVVQYLYAPTAAAAAATIHVDARFQEELKKTPHSRFQQNLYCMNGQQIIDAELQKIINQDDHPTTKTMLLRHYREFILALEDPSAATIVQKLRSYLRQLQNSTSKPDSDDDDNVETVAPIIAQFQSYTHSIYDTVRQHPLFVDLLQSTDNHPNQSDNLPALLQRCYDSFVYGHCYSYFHTLFDTLDVRQKSEQFQANVQFLSSFVTPVHLDIHCFTSMVSDQGESGNHATLTKEQNVKELLSKSVSMLQSIDTYYSPYEKLQCILRLYHEINIALKLASTSTTKLPSADDVLPTFIYVILLSVASTSSSSSSPLSEPHQSHNASNLYYNLYFIEQLLTSPSFISDTATKSRNHGSSSHNLSSIHYLRGEAGYAYTNLYSAYQFISDFDITSICDPFGTKSSPLVLQDKTASVDNAPPPPSSLSISKEAWNAVIEAYKVKAQERYDEIQKSSSATDMLRIDSYEPDLSFVDIPILDMNAPTPMHIRQARLRGETIDLNWAIQQQQVNNQGQSSAAVVNQPQLVAPRTVFEQVEENLPHGFQRNYTFLNARTVDDLKYHDVEQLLQEYHMLVRTTETLLSDRARQITRERRLYQLQKEKALIEQQQQQQQASYSITMDK